MNILIIGFTKIAYMPYINFYITELQKTNYDVSLIYWDRDSKPDLQIPNDIKPYCFNQNMLDSAPLINKVPNFIKYRNFVKKIINNNVYDLIIVLHSTPGVLLSDILTTKFKNRYILDYRDFTYENFNFYKRIIHKLVRSSAMTFVSSKGYLKDLPDLDKVHISHNLLIQSYDERNARRKSPRENLPIRIRFWGFIRHVEINKLIIDRLGNDYRFELHYHGREQESAQILKSYVKENQHANIFFHGEYQPRERITFASKTDLLHNIYENDIKTKPAMGNKYYDGLNFYIPQLCNKDSFMGDEVVFGGVGITLSPYDADFADKVYEYYKELDWKEFEQRCDSQLEEVIVEYSKGIQLFNNLLNRKKE